MGAFVEYVKGNQILSKLIDILVLIVCLKLIIDNQNLYYRLIEIEDYTVVQINNLRNDMKTLAKDSSQKMKLTSELESNYNEEKLNKLMIEFENLKASVQKLNQQSAQESKKKPSTLQEILNSENHELKDILSLDMSYENDENNGESVNQEDLDDQKFIDYNEESHITIFDLNEKLEPEAFYDTIKCRNSSMFYASVTLCIHDLDKDKHISKQIWEQGNYKPHLIKLFSEYLLPNPNWLVLDIGAHLGQYSLMAAKMGHNVLAVEPFFDSNLIMHKAVVLSNLQDKIILVSNAISNQNKKIMTLEPKPDNVGEQGLLDISQRNYELDTKYMVETIIMDDLIDCLPKQKYNDTTTTNQKIKSIMKIDIQGYEPFAFENAHRLFERLDVEVIFMNWKQMTVDGQTEKNVPKMIDFLMKNNLYPFSTKNEKLNSNKWNTWPTDIIWKKL